MIADNFIICDTCGMPERIDLPLDEHGLISTMGKEGWTGAAQGDNWVHTCPVCNGFE